MDNHNTNSVLAGVPFLDICTDEQLQLLAFASEPRDFKAGDELMAQNEVADGAFVLVRGSVAIGEAGAPTSKSFGVSGPNAMLGELALMLSRPQRKTITAVTDLQTVFIPRAAFLKLLRQYPDLAERAAERIQGELSGFLDSLESFRGYSRDQ